MLCIQNEGMNHCRTVICSKIADEVNHESGANS